MSNSMIKRGAAGVFGLTLAACSATVEAPRPAPASAPTPGSRAEAIILPDGAPLADPDIRIAVPHAGPGMADRAGHGVLSYSGRNIVRVRENGPSRTDAWTVRESLYCITRANRREVCFTLYQTGANTYALWAPTPLRYRRSRPPR